MQSLKLSQRLTTVRLTAPRWGGFNRRPRRLQAPKWCAHQVEELGDAASSPSPLSSTLEVLNNAQSFHMKSLDQAEDEMYAYCSMLSDDEDASRCWDAYEYLENKRKEAEDGCALELTETGKPGPKCARLQQLEQLTYELIGAGEVSGIVSALATLSRAEKKAALKRQEGREGEAVAWLEEGDDVLCVVTSHGKEMEEMESVRPDRRDKLRSVFMKADHDHDGRLDMEEFVVAMRMLGEELDEHTVELIGEALEAHGHLDEDQFIQVVEAEEVESHDKVAQMWRQRHPSSKWWGEQQHSKWGGVEG